MHPLYNNSEIIIRPAVREDMVAVAEMIQELAQFEDMPNGPKLSVKELQRDGFENDPPLFHCMVAAREDNELVGYALYFSTYSTWEGPAVMLEDLYVRPTERQRGTGKQLFNAVAKWAAEMGGSRLDLNVLEWNPARQFYSKMGARDLTEERWCRYRLDGHALAERKDTNLS